MRRAWVSTAPSLVSSTQPVRPAPDRAHLGAGPDLAAARLTSSARARANRRQSMIAGRRDVEGAEATDVRLDLAHRGRSELADALDSVRDRPLAEGGQARQLLLARGDDQLAAALEGDAVLVGEGVGRVFPSAHRRALQRAGRVVVRASGPRPSCGRSGGVASSRSFSSTARRRPGRASRRRSAVASPTMPPPTTTRSNRSLVTAAGWDTGRSPPTAEGHERRYFAAGLPAEEVQSPAGRSRDVAVDGSRVGDRAKGGTAGCRPPARSGTAAETIR